MTTDGDLEALATADLPSLGRRVRDARLSARIARRKAPGTASLRRLLAVSLPPSLAIRRLWGEENQIEERKGPEFGGWQSPAGSG